MTAQKLRELFPNASQEFIRANADIPAGNRRQASKLEPNLGDGTVGQAQVQTGLSQRFLVRVTSFRRRLLDEDNLCEKYHVDLCRYTGVLPGDEAGRTKIEVTQEKVRHREREFTRIEIFDLCNAS